MELPSVKINNIHWNIQPFGETAWLIKPLGDRNTLANIHRLSKSISRLNLPEIIDVVTAYDSMALFLKHSSVSINDLLDKIELASKSEITSVTSKHIVKVCYELGLDWETVTNHTGISKETIIAKHLDEKYTVAMMGFLPGFVFLDGLNAEISVPRKENPRVKIPSGSVGIGGVQTGFYSLESPGGWQIIGRTPQLYFDINKEPPTEIEAGDTIVFERITEQEFHLLASKWDR